MKPAHVVPRPIAGLAVACTFLFLSGCAALRRPSGSSLELGEADRDFARALAHYAQGLVREKEEGRGSAEALAHYARAAELDPGQHRLHAKAATGYFMRKEPSKALETLLQSCRERPESIIARIDLATAYQIAGDVDSAVREYECVIRQDPARPSVHMAIASLRFRDGRDAEALRALARAYDDAGAPDSIRAYCYTWALRFVHDKASLRAIECLRFVAERSESDSAQLYHLIGELFETEEKPEQARKYYALATKQDAPLAQSFVKLAILQLADDPAGAIETLLRGEKTVTSNLLILLALGQFYSNELRLDEAVKTFRRVAEQVKQTENQTLTTGFYLQYGSACERSGLIEEAERVFEECLTVYPDAHQVLNYLAYMWAESGEKLDKALDYINRALAHEPENGAYLDTLGWIYYKQKDYANAVVQVLKANEHIKDDPTITDHLGDIFKALGRDDRALACWKTSFMLDPSSPSVGKKLSQSGVDVKALTLEAEKARQGSKKD